MYTREQLERYPYFAEKLRETDLNNLLDELTGLVSRGHILWFVQWLIVREIPFSFAMLDLDNFKYINDTYGHAVGDQVLCQIAGNLADFLGDRGLVGRFGGDEMLIVNLKDVTYEDNKRFFVTMYDGEVVRKDIRLADCSTYVTGTVGCASFPKDTTDYNELFEMIDKTLYRGKLKGRNCYIIYVEEKHKDIDIRQIARHGMYTSLKNLIRSYEFARGLQNKLRNVLPLLIEELKITDLYYVGAAGMMRAVRQAGVAEPVSDLEKLLGSEDVYCNNSLEEVKVRSPQFYEAVRKREVETLCVVRIEMNLQTDGYLICAEPRSRRIWTEADCAILYFLSKMLAASIRIDGDKLE